MHENLYDGVRDDVRLRLFISSLLLVTVGGGIILVALGSWTATAHFLIAFLGLLVATEVFTPRNTAHQWWQAVRVGKVLGWMILIYIIVMRVLAVVG